MSIQENIEQSKKYILNNKLNKSLELLHASINLDLNAQDEIFFLIGKIYFIKRKYKKSAYYLNKVKREDLKQFSYDLLIKIYGKSKEYNKILNIFHKLEKKNVNNFILYTVLIAAYKLEKISKIFFVINIIRNNNINDNLLEKLINSIYKDFSEKIQLLNMNNNKEKVKSLFKKIYKFIPNNDIKFKDIILNEYEVAMLKTKLKSYPRLIQVVITTSCNLNCIMCGKSNHDGKYVFSDEYFYDLVQIMPYLQRLVLRGGEVFFYRNFDKLIDEAYKNNVVIEILTNGLLLNENNIRKFIKTNSVLTFSIDSPIKETYEFIRRGANFDKLISNILLLNKIKEEMNSNIKFNINMVVMRKNYREIFNMIDFAKKYNFQGLNLNPITGKNDENCFIYNKNNLGIINELIEKRKEYELMAKNKGIILINKLPKDVTKLPNFEDIEKYNEKILKINATKNDNMKTSDNIYDNKSFKNNGIKNFCYTPWREIFLDDNHCYSPNCLCKKRHEIYNLNTDNSILYLWNSNLMKEYRKNISIGKEYKICSKECLNNECIGYDRYRII